MDLILIVLVLAPLSENIVCKAAYDRERRRPERFDLVVYILYRVGIEE